MTLTAKHIAPGDVIPHTPSSAVAAGDVVVVGDVVAVATRPIAANELGALAVEGIFEFPKFTNSGDDEMTPGTKVYWDSNDEVITTTAGSFKVAGYVTETAADEAATVRVKLARA